jgi:methylated-DNA-[protein]-cysteine S-methyltransferase
MIHVYHTKLDGVWYGAAVQDEKVGATYFSVEEPDLEQILQSLQYDVPFQVLEEPSQLLADVIEALQKAFNGKHEEPHGFEIDLGQLSDYAKKVLECNCRVPVGYVTSYGAVAKVAGGSARSVGQVEASNRVPLLIPCHRVVCSDLSLGGYGGGKKVKQQILRRERRGYEEPKELTVGDKKLAVFPTEWVKQKQV